LHPESSPAPRGGLLVGRHLRKEGPPPMAGAVLPVRPDIPAIPSPWQEALVRRVRSGCRVASGAQAGLAPGERARVKRHVPRMVLLDPATKLTIFDPTIGPRRVHILPPARQCPVEEALREVSKILREVLADSDESQSGEGKAPGTRAAPPGREATLRRWCCDARRPPRIGVRESGRGHTPLRRGSGSRGGGRP
jgi:hypothetical protein